MALSKGPGGMGTVVWLATRTIRSAEETGIVLGPVSKSKETASGPSIILGTRRVPTRGSDKEHPLLRGSRYCDASVSVSAYSYSTTGIYYTPTARVVMVR
jgi:hypothetical protein